MADDLFFGDFVVDGKTYTVIEEDYLVDGIEELTSLDDAINAAKHAAIQRMAQAGNRETDLLRGDYHFGKDPIDFEGTVLIFDGNNMAHRARHTFKLSYKHWDVSVTYGVLTMMAATVRKFGPVSAIIVCWDGGVPQFRYDNTPDYKRRDHSDEADYQEFLLQLQKLTTTYFPAMGVYSVRKPKTEADDLIYQATRLIHPDYRSIVISTDQDLLQCINYHTDVWQPTKEKLITLSSFQEYTGLTRADYLIYRSMVGDSSDGVDGIKGIGEKTALKLIADYGASPSNLVNVASGLNTTVPAMSPAIAEKIRAYGLTGFQKTLNTIRLDRDLCGARYHLLYELKKSCNYDHARLTAALKEYAFVSLLDSEFFNCFKNLSKPILTGVDNIRYPKVMLHERKPVVKT